MTETEKFSGFRYEVPKEKIAEYGRWPIEKRLKWLYEGNRLRNLLPQNIIAIQERFRKGE